MAAREDGYLPVAKGFHWVTAVLMFAVFPLGAVIKFVKDDVKMGFYLVHESLGLLVLLLVLARLFYRLRHPAPPPLPGMPRSLQMAANAVHWGLYAALIAMPISGFLATNAWGFPLSWFGLIPVPSPIGENKEIAPTLSLIHETLAWTILVLFTLHLSAGLYHHVLKRDGTLQRMI